MNRDIKLRIIHMSDTHFSKYTAFDEDAFRNAVKYINKLDPPPDAVIHSGDITDYGVLADYEVAYNKLSEINYEIYYAPGNHDERNYGQSLFKEFFGNMDRFIDLGSAVILLMNSPEPDRDAGRLGRRRQRFIESTLKTFSTDKIKIIVFHHHLVPVPLSGREANVLEDAGDVLELVLRNSVDMVLMGHRHVRRALQIGGSLLINAGTVSSIRTRGRLGHSMNQIDIYEDTIKIWNIQLDGKLKLTPVKIMGAPP